jgi:HlyD family secretion protein
VLVGSSGLELPGVVEEIGLRVGRKDVLSNDPVSDTDARVVEVRVRLGPDGCREVAGLSNARVEVSIEAEE